MSDLSGTASLKTELVNLGISVFITAFAMGICALSAGIGCIVTGLVAGALGGMITGSNEANELKLKGSERSQFILSSTALGLLGGGSTSVVVKGTKALLHQSPRIIKKLMPAKPNSKELLVGAYSVGIDKLSSMFVYQPVFMERYSVIGRK